MRDKILLFLLLIPAITIGMESQEPMTEIKTMEEAKQFAGKIVVYKPRVSLGESLAEVTKKEQINYGYIESDLDFFPKSNTNSPQGPVFLRLYALNLWNDYVITRVISDKTLAQEALVLRCVKSAVEFRKIITILQDDNYRWQFRNASKYQESNFNFKVYDSKYMKNIIERQAPIEGPLHPQFMPY